MAREHQQGTWTQLRLFEEQGGSVRHGAESDGGSEPQAHEEGQAATASNRERALTDNLTRGTSRYNRRRNRHVRIRTHGGVGGRGPRGPLLPDC